MSKKKSRFKKPAPKSPPDQAAAPAKGKKPSAQDQAALDAALLQAGNPGSAGASAAADAVPGAPSGAPMLSNQQRMLNRYGAGS